MNQLHPEAIVLNDILKKDHPSIYQLLSEKGRKIFYPRKGMLQQGLDAKGKDINATVGMAIEDDKSPMRLKSLSEGLSIPPERAFPYAPSFGILELRKDWQKLIKDKNPSLKSNFSLPIVTCGLTHGLSVVGYLFIDPEDPVILPDVLWGNYRLIFEHPYEARFHHFNTFDVNGFDLDSLRKMLSEIKGKQILLLNFPNNPTGYTPTETEANKIADIILQSAKAGNKIAVIHDDAYFGLVYKEGIYKESLFAKLADLHENILAIKIDGATKEDYAWGFRVGFITFASKGMTDDVCQALESKTAGRVRGNISSSPHISQSHLLNAINSPSYHEEKKIKFELLKSRFDRVQKVLAENKEKYAPFFHPLPFNSGYFMCIRLSESLDAESIRQILLNDFSTGIIALKDSLRIAFSCVAEKDIPLLFENIYSACKKYPEGKTET